MSGFEALGIASSILQVISFAAGTTRLCKAFYDGTETPDDDLYNNVSSMVEVTKSLQVHLNKVESDPTARWELIDIARKCQKTAEEIQREVVKVRNWRRKANGNVLKSYSTALKFLVSGSKKKIMEFDKTLKDYQSTMESSILVRVCKRSDAVALRQEEYFSELSRDFQHFVSQFADGQTKVSSLVNVEHNRTRDHITEQRQQAVSSIIAHQLEESTQKFRDARRERLLQSLEYGRMNQRREGIDEAAKTTYNWVLNLNPDGKPAAEITRVRRWPDFMQWLESGNNIYWITGKPGAGKSTLVKFLASHPATAASLEKWRLGTKIISHYFWKVGGGMQNSLVGFWCSLLHQALAVDAELIDHVYHTVPNAKFKKEYCDWSKSLLRTTCLDIFARLCYPVCLFIDGLDEIDDRDGAAPLLQAIEDIRKVLGQRGRICVSSRQEYRFKKVPKHDMELELHTLTLEDMYCYVRRRLVNCETYSSTRISDSLALGFADILVGKASGVFIWLALALKSVIRGFENGDSEEEIRQRSEQLPDDIENLYSDMWNRLNVDIPIYKRKAAEMLNFMLKRSKLSIQDSWLSVTLGYDPDRLPNSIDVIELVIATNPALQSDFFNQVDGAGPVGKAQLEELCKRTQHDSETRCAGLLTWQKQGEGQWHEAGFVDFIHRTAVDFLEGTELGQRILSYDISAPGAVYVNAAKALLGWHIASPYSDQDSQFFAIRLVIRALAQATEFMHKETISDAKKILNLCFELYPGGTKAAHGGYLVLEPATAVALEQGGLEPWVWEYLERCTNSSPATAALHWIAYKIMCTGSFPRDGYHIVSRLVSQGADATTKRVVGYLGALMIEQHHSYCISAIEMLMFHLLSLTRPECWKPMEIKQSLGPLNILIAGSDLSSLTMVAKYLPTYAFEADDSQPIDCYDPHITSVFATGPLTMMHTPRYLTLVPMGPPSMILHLASSICLVYEVNLALVLSAILNRILSLYESSDMPILSESLALSSRGPSPLANLKYLHVVLGSNPGDPYPPEAYCYRAVDHCGDLGEELWGPNLDGTPTGITGEEYGQIKSRLCKLIDAGKMVRVASSLYDHVSGEKIFSCTVPEVTTTTS